MAVEDVRSYSYQYGTEAPKYPYEVKRPAQTPEFEPLKRPSKKAKPKLDILYTIKMTTCGVLVFGSALSFVHLTSNLSEKQSQLKEVTTQIRETQSDINSVQAIIASHLDLEAIQEKAQNELGMSEPLPHQVVYLELPQESYTVYYD